MSGWNLPTLSGLPEVLHVCNYEKNTEELCGAPTAYLFSWKNGDVTRYVSACGAHREIVQAHIRAAGLVIQSLEVN